VHVLDSSAPDLDEHRSTVLQVLQQIDVSEEKINNMIEVWNKVLIEISFSLALGNHLVVILDLYIS
jgi:50S ribosomal subunit-associated GTPase HflX